MELTERVTRETRDAAGLLVLRPASESDSDATCRRLLAGGSRPVNLFGVCFSRPPARWYDDWVAALDGPPANAAVVTTPDQATDELPDGVAVETVPTPADLTSIGMRATRYTGSWADDSNAEIIVSVDSLDALLRHVSLKALYRFLHVLVGRLDTLGFDERGAESADGPRLGARGLFFLDPSTQEETTVTTLESLFHGVLSYEGDGGWRLRTQ
ncbi:DUF7504 family protein [Halogeometricum luteum]|uniref:RecA-superfamily ATPase, KaiC/GvpD/RAD55 family n=1 Tax=Halogeometricum luteum TaxID=2950537 RepID=A0ABU2G4Z5_9EURY|nr:hypothetical protein [Halogeometricum sp. S3BR5-2]MDS0295845.1 hypothetical protein [Halogeometricum sp. S3BR5-2]